MDFIKDHQNQWSEKKGKSWWKCDNKSRVKNWERTPSSNTITTAFVRQMIHTQWKRKKKNWNWWQTLPSLNRNSILEEEKQNDEESSWESNSRSKIHVGHNHHIYAAVCPCSPQAALMICCQLETEHDLRDHYLAGQKLQFPSKSIQLLLLALMSIKWKHSAY